MATLGHEVLLGLMCSMQALHPKGSWFNFQVTGLELSLVNLDQNYSACFEGVILARITGLLSGL